MEILLHIGAHRTATTRFQIFLNRNRAGLRDRGIAIWGPGKLRKGAFPGLLRDPAHLDRRLIAQTRTRIGMELHRLERQGVETLLVSEENLIGTMRNNIATQRLYPQARARVAQAIRFFPKQNMRLFLSIRPYDSYWASALAYSIRHHDIWPDPLFLDRLSRQPRRWRDLISEFAALIRGPVDISQHRAPLRRPEQQLAAMLGTQMPDLIPADERHNRAFAAAELLDLPDLPKQARDVLRAMPGAYAPFTRDQTARLEAAYAEDLLWLREGAKEKVRMDQQVGETPDDDDRQGSSDARDRQGLVRTG